MTHCRYISWQRSSLEYLFVKETVLANVFGVLVARDVINKVNAMSRKVLTNSYCISKGGATINPYDT